MAHVDKLPLQI